ncbi:sulfurtransferase [Gordonia sp. (in: high G+C Gram-positive bacteria)]|uniref:sulfurtransferase n=1 Tax=Gordonia sp. (in: high G+C Gram-positive bacteria) TaxID=84139 RepID=UPI0035281040
MTDALPTPLVDPEWLAEHLGEPGLVVIDATSHLTVPDDGRFAIESGAATYRAEHIPGALFADLLADFADPASDAPWTAADHDRFAAAAGALGIGEGARVVVYSQHWPFWATRFWWQLRLEGFDHVAVLDGGLPAWKAAGGAVTGAPSVPEPRVFTGVRRPGLVRSTEQVAAALDDENTILVNVLGEEDHRGETATYARPGHIPGSSNFPAARLLDPETGRLRPAAELRSELAAAGLLDAGRTVVTYCGAGIAATGVALALTQAGADEVGVYDGSLIAWTADPDLPMATGTAPR